jgi:hypothetical protein
MEEKAGEAIKEIPTHVVALMFRLTGDHLPQADGQARQDRRWG